MDSFFLFWKKEMYQVPLVSIKWNQFLHPHIWPYFITPTPAFSYSFPLLPVPLSYTYNCTCSTGTLPSWHKLTCIPFLFYLIAQITPNNITKCQFLLPSSICLLVSSASSQVLGWARTVLVWTSWCEASSSLIIWNGTVTHIMLYPPIWIANWYIVTYNLLDTC